MESLWIANCTISAIGLICYVVFIGVLFHIQLLHHNIRMILIHVGIGGSIFLSSSIASSFLSDYTIFLNGTTTVTEEFYRRRWATIAVESGITIFQISKFLGFIERKLAINEYFPTISYVICLVGVWISTIAIWTYVVLASDTNFVSSQSSTIFAFKQPIALLMHHIVLMISDIVILIGYGIIHRNCKGALGQFNVNASTTSLTARFRYRKTAQLVRVLVIVTTVQLLFWIISVFITSVDIFALSDLAKYSDFVCIISVFAFPALSIPLSRILRQRLLGLFCVKYRKSSTMRVPRLTTEFSSEQEAELRLNDLQNQWNERYNSTHTK